MAWFKVDDVLHGHPKARRAGVAAMGLWVVSGSYAMQYLTDGFVPDWYVASWPQGRALARKLEDARMWEPAERAGEQGWQFRDWLDYQPGVDEVEADREANRERQRRFRQARREQKRASADRATDKAIDAMRNGGGNGVTNGVTNDPPLPSRPDPAPSISKSPSSGGEPKQRAEFATQPCGRSHDPATSCGACAKARRDEKAQEAETAKAKAARNKAIEQAASDARRAEAAATPPDDGTGYAKALEAVKAARG